MEAIVHFSEKSLWSQNNNIVNLWICPSDNQLETSYIKSMFKNQPFFAFHPSVGVSKGFCHAMNFNYDDEYVKMAEELIQNAHSKGDVVGSIAKYYTFFLQPYGDITINVIQ
jgi:hypothetical protein